MLRVVKSFEEALAEIDTFSAHSEIPVEPKIKSLVAALRMFGVNTIQSCEGHVGVRDPYVQAVPEDGLLLLELVTHFNRHDRPDRGKHYYWVIDPMPFAIAIRAEQSEMIRPVEILQREAEEFAQALIRLAVKLQAETQS